MFNVFTRAPGVVERVRGLHDLYVELDVLGLLLADHDWVVQVEVQQDQNLLLGRLEKGQLDV